MNSTHAKRSSGVALPLTPGLTWLRPGLLAGVLLLGALAWSYWPVIADLNETWAADDDYSVGQLVPFVALYLLWRVRADVRWSTFRPHWGGAALLAASQALRFFGLYYAYGSAERLSLVLAISGTLLLVAGPRVWLRLIWLQVFLLLMLPLPHRIHNLISAPLQGWATSLACFGLELLGYYVHREGNVLHVDGRTAVMVAEACSGLRLLTAFIFTSAVLAFVVQRPRWQKIVVLLSSVPIAVLANAVRVLTTSMVVQQASDPSIEARFHDLAGLLMMPLALLLLAGELKFLSALMKSDDAAPARRGRARGMRPAARLG